jgi:hypothetical protein
MGCPVDRPSLSIGIMPQRESPSGNGRQGACAKKEALPEKHLGIPASDVP